MRYETKTVRVGELLGDIDWSYDFRSHFDCVGADDAGKQAVCDRQVERLRLIHAARKAERDIEATTYGGWQRCGWGKVLAVGMYDGWPYWKPTPSVLISGWAGPSWACFSEVTDIREVVERADAQEATK